MLFFKSDIFSKDVVLIPIHHPDIEHWSAVAINFQCKRLESYNSLGSRHNSIYAVSS